MPVPVLRRIMLLVSVAICLTIASGSLPAAAQPKSSDRASFPGRRIGGGTRSECLIGNRPLVALNPVNNLGITAHDRPSIYFSVPQFAESYPLKFSLKDERGNSVYETTLETDKTKELVGIQLPKNTLKVGQDYRWYFSVLCDSDDRSQDIVLSGWLRRVEASIVSSQASGLDAHLNLAQSYEKRGLWNDAIAVLVELRQTYPQDEKVGSQWQKLLEQLELKSVFDPMVMSQR